MILSGVEDSLTEPQLNAVLGGETRELLKTIRDVRPRWSQF